MHVKHIVMFTIQDDAPEEKVEAMKQGLLSLPKLVDGFIGFELGVDLKLAPGQNHPAGKNRSIVWTAWFASVPDYERYNESKEHIAVVNDLIKPIIVPGSRAAIQYECH
ncbi:stress responsive A/B barrel domain containing protein [Nitzschia inconspicua]|uniref:Stress responsive A/B barrel domain containing protein n=1 Tax=Nitzschia inconspicua TaxID=303405 RepID=A0A9K3LZ04_9STRA|nr:stress responsive A/B barrel domain containing protein [Nitzschia inconspicua]